MARIGIFASSLLAFAAAPAAPDLPYETLAQDFREAYGIENKSPAEIDFDDVLQRSFARMELGVFDARYPVQYLTEKEDIQRFRDIGVALLDLQIDWLEGRSAAEGREELLEDLEDLRKWLAKARFSKSLAKADPTDFFHSLGAKDEQVELATKLAQSFVSGEAFGFEPRRKKAAQVIFMPTRVDFLGLCSFIGWLDKPWRPTYWNNQIPVWTEFYWKELQVVALQYPPPQRRDDDLSQHVPMDDREKTGTLQHAAQRAAFSLMWFCFDFSLDPAVQAGIAQNAVIDVFGENNTRSGGGGRGRETEARAIFIPGGLSQGGVLPRNNADSEWREELGGDYFVKSLRASQKGGAKMARKSREKVQHFQLTGDDDVQRAFVTAPFFGSAAEERDPPERQFMTDYREFFRAYKSCFVFWLENEYGDRKTAGEVFSGLLAQLAAAGSKTSFEEVVEAHYGVPLSSADPESGALEWQFLEWLSKR